MRKIISFVPGVLLALGIAFVAKWLEGLEQAAGFHVIGASVIALFLGMAVHAAWKPNRVTAPGIQFTSKKLLKFAIILLGASLNIQTVLTVGKFSLTVMLFTLATCFGLGALIGKALGLNWKSSSLINAGTGICGGSAIAAIAPVIEADDMDIAYAMSATFLFDTVMIVLFPLFGRWLGLSDAAFGLWAGTAVNDTSSGQADENAFDHSGGAGLCRGKFAHQKEAMRAGKRRSGSHHGYFPVVYPGVSCHVCADQLKHLARRLGRGYERDQQVPDGCRFGCDRLEHKLQIPVPLGRKTHAAWLYRFAIGRACRHRC